jgi:hypothetical protein
MEYNSALRWAAKQMPDIRPDGMVRSRMGRGRLRPRVLSLARRLTGTSHPDEPSPPLLDAFSTSPWLLRVLLGALVAQQYVYRQIR